LHPNRAPVGVSGLVRVFFIVDNGSSHRGQASVERATKAWPNLTLVHLPVHASWLNQIEIYFSIIQRKVLAPNVSTDLAESRTGYSPSRTTTNGSPPHSSGSSPAPTSTASSPAVTYPQPPEPIRQRTSVPDHSGSAPAVSQRRASGISGGSMWCHSGLGYRTAIWSGGSGPIPTASVRMQPQHRRSRTSPAPSRPAPPRSARRGGSYPPAAPAMTATRSDSPATMSSGVTGTAQPSTRTPR
jgi:hypothetical protein